MARPTSIVARAAAILAIAGGLLAATAHAATETAGATTPQALRPLNDDAVREVVKTAARERTGDGATTIPRGPAEVSTAWTDGSGPIRREPLSTAVAFAVRLACTYTSRCGNEAPTPPCGEANHFWPTAGGCGAHAPR